MKIIMTPVEVDLLSNFMSSSSSYFEFGMGGSTCLAATLVKSSIHAIESDAEWVQKVRGTVEPTSKKKLRLEHVDIGKTGGWGTPIGRDYEHLFSGYSTAIRNADVSSIDLCLVDGRFRVASFLEALSCLRGDAVIAMHDYQIRPEYHLIEEFARPIAKREQLSFFVRRPNVNLELVSKLATEYRLNPA